MIDKIRLLLALPAVAFSVLILWMMVSNAYQNQWDTMMKWWLVGLIVGIPLRLLFSKRGDR